jgi:hypothetical protein
MNINSLNNAMLYEHLRTLNGRNLARMMATSRKYRNFIRADPRLMARINQTKRNITRERINQEVAAVAAIGHGQWALRPQHVNILVNRAMRRVNHPLTRQEIFRIIHNIMR